MNISGEAIFKIYKKMDFNHLIILVDELDLGFGEIKHKFSSENRGHNGIRSINNSFKCKYWQIIIGIDRPKDNLPISDYVLSKISYIEREQIPVIAYKVGHILFNIIHQIKDGIVI